MTDIEARISNGIKVVGKYDQENKMIMLQKDLSHLYRALNSFCINRDALYNYPDWEKIRIAVGVSLIYEIDRIEFDKFNKYLNSYISYLEEKQLAIPICLFNKLDLNTGLIEKAGVTIKEFVEIETLKPEYQKWGSRIKSNYYLQGI